MAAVQKIGDVEVHVQILIHHIPCRQVHQRIRMDLSLEYPGRPVVRRHILHLQRHIVIVLALIRDARVGFPSRGIRLDLVRIGHAHRVLVDLELEVRIIGIQDDLFRQIIIHCDVVSVFLHLSHVLVRPDRMGERCVRSGPVALPRDDGG